MYSRPIKWCRGFHNASSRKMVPGNYGAHWHSGPRGCSAVKLRQLTHTWFADVSSDRADSIITSSISIYLLLLLFKRSSMAISSPGPLPAIHPHRPAVVLPLLLEGWIFWSSSIGGSRETKNGNYIIRCVSCNVPMLQTVFLFGWSEAAELRRGRGWSICTVVESCISNSLTREQFRFETFSQNITYLKLAK